MRDRPQAAPAVMLPRRSTFRVPGSTSNLGAGFDCVGIAVDLWLTASATVIGSTYVVRRSGTLAQLDCAAEDDLLVQAFVAACRYRERDLPPGVTFEVDSAIPVARGLGSSAAAIVAGVVLASDLLAMALTEREIIDVAASVDGHPDNVSPSVIGGAVLCVHTGPLTYAVAPLRVHPSIRLIFAIPDFEFRTSTARAVLPATLPFATAVDAAARAAALVTGLGTANEQLLRAGLADVLHVPFRRDRVTGYDTVTRAACDAGAVGATLSGSGSAIVAVMTSGADPHVVGDAMLAAWRSAGVEARILTSSADVEGLSTADAAGAAGALRKGS
ncbi:MAG: homoserine kinase [Gemmatimonadaceae bacterium]